MNASMEVRCGPNRTQIIEKLVVANNCIKNPVSHLSPDDCH